MRYLNHTSRPYSDFFANLANRARYRQRPIPSVQLQDKSHRILRSDLYSIQDAHETLDCYRFSTACISRIRQGFEMDNSLMPLKEIEDIESLHRDGSSIVHYKPPREQEFAQQIEQEIKEGERFAQQLSKLQQLQNEFHSRLAEVEKEGAKQTQTQDDPLHLRQEIENEYHSRLKKENEIARNIKTHYDSLDPLGTRPLTADLIKESKRRIVDNALKVICKNLACQSAAIFLFSKSGRLERVGIRGWDEKGNEIRDNWFQTESYAVGESFTGRAAQPKTQGYGQIQLSTDLGNAPLNQTSRRQYEETFGKLHSAIAIPLNGRNKTYGVLRIINKITENEKGEKTVLSDHFKIEDVRLLLSLSNYVSTTLSNFRRDVQGHILKYLSHRLIGNFDRSPTALHDLFQDIVDLLVENPETAYQAVILRIKDENGDFKHEASSLFDGVSQDRDNRPKTANDAHIWKMVAEGKRLIIQDLQTSSLLKHFKNAAWAERNQFQAFGCFPLGEKGDVIGTLSVYLGRNYRFYPDAVVFLQNIADLLALFLFTLKQEALERSLNLQLQSIAQSRSDQDVEQRFRALAADWRRKTAQYPILFDRLVHPSYQKIIGLGSAVVPTLLRELKQKPDHWFWALEAIVGDSPVQKNHEGMIPRMIEDWLEWGRNQGYVFE
ncbi:hypothetical protein LEP3755_31380 [Leptolyngbya sp. NIES-3755]|nr:hypothetical protein LEP3755_31380 [Leptolyngbya sp. NIES-3755]